MRVGDDDTILAVGGALAREHQVIAVGGRLHVVHEAGVRLDGINDDRFRRIADVDGVDAVPAAVRTEVCDLAVRVDPDFRRREERAWQPADDRHWSPNVALGHVHDCGRAPRADICHDLIVAGPVGDEVSLGVDLAVPG